MPTPLHHVVATAAAPLALSGLLGLTVPTCILAGSLRTPPATRPEAGAADRAARELLEFDLADLPFDVDLQGSFSGIDVGRSNRSRGALLQDGRKPLLWLHIHKAAGSFMCWMANDAGEQVVAPNDGNCNWKVHDSYGKSGDESNAVGCGARRNYFHSNGYTYGQVERELYPSELQCGGDFNYGVFLREPFALMLSTLNYNSKFWHGKGRGVLSELRHRLDSRHKLPGGPTQRPEWKTLDNFQTRLLANAWDVPAGQISQEHLKRARETLEGFEVVARVEDLPSRGADLFQTLGWPRSLAGRISRKVNAVSHASVDFSDDEVDWLRQVNAMDIQLYNEVADKPYGAMVH